MPHDILLILISVFVSTVVGQGVVWGKWLREREGIRRLVASEIIDNFTNLHTFTGQLRMTADQRAAVAKTFDRSFSYLPTWRRVQWDKAVAAAFSPDELYRTNDWYNQLEAATNLRNQVAAHSALLREQVISRPIDAVILGQVVAGMLGNLDQFARSVYDQGRPFVHKQIDEAHEKERLRRAALAQSQPGPDSKSAEELPQ